LGNFLPHFGRRSRDQVGVLDAILLDKGTLAGKWPLPLGFFEVERHDRETFVTILLIELNEEACFIVAVRAPGAGYDRKNHFALETRIVAGAEVREPSSNPLRKAMSLSSA